RYLRGAFVGGVLLGSTTAAFGQIAGTVDANGGPLGGATVEVWDSYPDGSILTQTTTNGSGQFAFGAIGPSTFDLRVRKSGYYPTVVRDLPHPIDNTEVELTATESVSATPTFSDFYDDATTFLGELVRDGDVITARDPQQVLCGLTDNIPANGAYLLHVRGDAPGGGDEGALAGDEISFYINGLAASPTATWIPLASSTHTLSGPTQVPGATVVGPPDVGGLPGQSALISYNLTNSGHTVETFSFDISIDLGWSYSIISPTAIELQPGENVQVDILVDVPVNAAGQTAALLFSASADAYAPANCGAITRIEVNTTGVGTGGGGLLPNQFALAQNYPNPFNPETQIAYSIRVEGRARMEVFNLLGQSVAVLFDEHRPAGVDVVEWDGTDRNGQSVPSGIYFYRLTQDSQALTRKMILLK
ncbi:MAG: T9SS type A sorting domain-containing protein, partial [Candidatus Zixiibacteriota bacterium]